VLLICNPFLSFNHFIVLYHVYIIAFQFVYVYDNNVLLSDLPHINRVSTTFICAIEVVDFVLYIRRVNHFN